jgi:hypothetical protein
MGGTICTVCMKPIERKEKIAGEMTYRWVGNDITAYSEHFSHPECYEKAHGAAPSRLHNARFWKLLFRLDRSEMRDSDLRFKRWMVDYPPNRFSP